jgi:hypothetical protein
MAHFTDSELATIARPFITLTEALKGDNSPQATALKKHIAEVDKILSSSKSNKSTSLPLVGGSGSGSVLNDYFNAKKTKEMFEMFKLTDRI